MALTDNLSAYYDLDEASGDAIDSHNGHNATETSGTIGTGTGPGGTGGARDFEFLDSEWFQAADHADLSMGDIDFTVVAWANFESLPGAGCSFAYKGTSNDLAYELGFNSVRYYFRVSSAAGFANLTSVVATTFDVVPTGEWHMIAARHDATANTIDISVDGGAVDSTSYSSGSYDDGGDLYLGNNPFGTAHDGLQAMTGIWKGKCLSDAELDELYNAGVGLRYDDFAGGGGGFIAFPRPRGLYAGMSVMSGGM